MKSTVDESGKDAEATSNCHVFGTRIFETGLAKQITTWSTTMTFVISYYGYGKTYGVGGYVICKAQKEGNYYLYTNLREVKERVKTIDVTTLSLYDVLKVIYQVFTESNVPLEELTRANILLTNISNLPQTLRQLRDNVEDIPVDTFIQTILPEQNKRLYIIIDELERVAADVKMAITKMCDEAKQLNTSLGGRVEVYVLLQEALLVERGLSGTTSLCEPSSAGRGVVKIRRLSGYSAEDYVNIMKELGIVGDEKNLRKVAEKLSKLPPRAVFGMFANVASVDEIEERIKTLNGLAEEFLVGRLGGNIKDPLNRLISYLNQLENFKINVIPVKIDARSKLFIYTLKVPCNKPREKSVDIKLCIDLREERQKTKQKFVEDCKILAYMDENGKLIINNKRYDVDVRLILAAYSGRPPLIDGLEKLYEEIRKTTYSYLKNAILKSCE